MPIRTLSLLALLLLAAAATADPVTDAADAVLAAFRAQQDLKDLAVRDDPDPWLVADELCARGEFGAAEAFAKAAPRPDTEKLPAYVAARRADPVRPEERAALALALRAHEAKQWAAALASMTATGTGLPAVRTRLLRGRVWAKEGRWNEALPELVAAASAARHLGWLAGSSEALEAGGVCAAHGLNRFDMALDVSRQRLELEQARGNRAGVGRALGLMALAFTYVEEHDRALDCFMQSDAIAMELGDVLDLQVNSANQAILHKSRFEYAEAVACLERYRKLCEQRGEGLWSAHVALAGLHSQFGRHAEALACLDRGQGLAPSEALHDVALNETRGNILLAMGDYEGARGCFERHREWAREQDNDPWVAATAESLGWTHLALRDYDVALRYAEAARDRWRALPDRGGASGVIRSAALAGAVCVAANRPELAIEHLRAANEAIERTGAPPSTQVLDNLGNAYHLLGKLDLALEYHGRAREIAVRKQLRDAELNALANLASDHARLGRYDRALALAREAVAMLTRLSGGLSEEGGAHLRGRWTRIFAVGAGAAAASHDAGQAAFFLECGRGMALLEALGGWERIQRGILPDKECEVLERAREAEKRAIVAYRRALETSGAVAERWNDVEVARTRLADAVRRVQREAKTGGALLFPDPDPADRIRASLQPGEALLLFGMVARDAVAVILDARGVRVVPLGPSEAILTAAEAFQRGAARPDERGMRAPPHERLPFLAKRLRELLLDPLDLGEGTTRLLVSPDDLLAYVPFCVLTDRDVAYVPSGTVLRLLREARAERGRKVLALGDARGADLVPLPESGAEARAVGDLVLLGDDACAAQLREALAKRERWRAVHFACHGLVDPERPALSELALTGEPLRCLDVYRMKIPADLVVLSACETAKGKVYAAEGVIGWTRAFMFAGAPRVIVSLWKVDDEATRALMEKFYELWKKGEMPAATALKKAQEHVASHEKWSHPYFWAAWQLWGLAE